MKKAIFIRFTLIILVAVALSSIISAAIVGDDMQNQTERDMLRILHVMAASYDPDASAQEQAGALSEAASGARVTILSPDGSVRADSHAAAAGMENHAGREEFTLARSEGEGISVRESRTVGRKLMYAAVRTESGDVLRLADDFDGMLANMGRQIPSIVISLIVAIGVSLLLADRMAHSVAAPLSAMSAGLLQIGQGNYDFQLPPTRYEELGRMADSIRSLADALESSASALFREREKVDYILKNMEEGLVLCDEASNVLTVNNSARRFFGCDEEVEGHNIIRLIRNTRVTDAVEDALRNGKSSLFDLETADGRIVSLHITRVRGDFLEPGRQAGVILLMIDVTADRTSQRTRQEFFSNASHELKTPITSIAGFAELLEAGVIKDPVKQDEYLRRIITESKRMAGLLGDILMISRLESGGGTAERRPVDLTAVCREVAGSLEPQARENGVTVSVEGGEAVVPADPGQMHELCMNLIENAVKYNRPGGRVDVRVGPADGAGRGVRLLVEDTGIGIPAESQDRLFERFYRVDKGRSRKMGGTGLGLSIVKHIVGAYGGEIALKSVEGEGTAITVVLPGGKK